MTDVVRAAHEPDVAAAIAEGTTLEIVSRGTKRTLGRPATAARLLDLGALSGITAYEPAELVLDARAATPLAEIAAALAASNQELAFEPPDLGPLLGTGAGKGSLAGVVACNLSGPRRIKAGAARDHVLGLSAVSGRGELFKAGGRVVKNVTGYDLCKLLTGSYGTLAVITALSVKVLPAAEKTRTLLLLGLDRPRAWEAMTRALASSHDVSAAAFIPAALAVKLHEPRARDQGSVTALRLEGPARSVAARLSALRDLLACATEELHSVNSRAFWKDIADAGPFVDDPRAVWRISVAPQAGLALAAAADSLGGSDVFFDWGGGLCWLAVPEVDDAGAQIIRAAVAAAGGGHATLVRASAQTRAAVAPFQPAEPPVAALEKQIKIAFDPLGLLNPGRMTAEI